MTGDDREPVTAVADPAALADEPDADWPVLDREVVCENPYFTAGYTVVESPEGAQRRWYWVDPADVVAVDAVDARSPAYGPGLASLLLARYHGVV